MFTNYEQQVNYILLYTSQLSILWIKVTISALHRSASYIHLLDYTIQLYIFLANIILTSK